MGVPWCTPTDHPFSGIFQQTLQRGGKNCAGKCLHFPNLSLKCTCESWQYVGMSRTCKLQKRKSSILVWILEYHPATADSGKIPYFKLMFFHCQPSSYASILPWLRKPSYVFPNETAKTRCIPTSKGPIWAAPRATPRRTTDPGPQRIYPFFFEGISNDYYKWSMIIFMFLGIHQFFPVINVLVNHVWYPFFFWKCLETYCHERNMSRLSHNWIHQQRKTHQEKLWVYQLEMGSSPTSDNTQHTDYNTIETRGLPTWTKVRYGIPNVNYNWGMSQSYDIPERKGHKHPCIISARMV